MRKCLIVTNITLIVILCLIIFSCVIMTSRMEEQTGVSNDPTGISATDSPTTGLLPIVPATANDTQATTLPVPLPTNSPLTPSTNSTTVPSTEPSTQVTTEPTVVPTTEPIGTESNASWDGGRV